MNLIANKVAKMVIQQLHGEATRPNYITCVEAAERLKVGVNWLRKTKDNYTYIKRGNRIYFDANQLFK
jgi:hypothetical protein